MVAGQNNLPFAFKKVYTTALCYECDDIGRNTPFANCPIHGGGADPRFALHQVSQQARHLNEDNLRLRQEIEKGKKEEADLKMLVEDLRIKLSQREEDLKSAREKFDEQMAALKI